MNKKSAAQFKPVAMSGIEKKQMQQQLEDLPPLEETWENAKQAFINTAEVSVTIANRIDNFMNVRDLVYKFWDGKKEINMDYLKAMHNISVMTYKAILECVKKFEMDEFLKEEMKDYFEEIIPKIEDINNEQELVEAAIVFLTVKPWGERMTSLHHTMLDEKKQREYLEG